MTLHKITAPVPGYTGVVAGVALANGVGETSDEGVLAYFHRHRYKVEAVEQAPEEDGGQGGGEQPPARPAKSASKADWLAYAVAQGMPEEEAEAATRDQLVERYAPADGGDA
ncbi:hypothetical protein ACOQFV_27335 [Nocardiopsis changdeensis]|uniref:Uncharacterized protein n=1 Tax=Nocardiopsis changdeensis TaxID=2831969 RepID=A0ABX8BL75_9ACTN|nr:MULTISPECIES: hypothetical protein [Nocardiopsis]QUX22982.1 hypothetical protein KGD84_00795 [Nocardiopsis changdeensis]QYX38925.1 hypothetical protein K1J57_10245 [Nocardiopsis sp. MT53]